VKDKDGKPLKDKNVFSFGSRRYPVFLVDIDTDSGKILLIQDLKPRHK
jgi:hypothetical protein